MAATKTAAPGSLLTQVAGRAADRRAGGRRPSRRRGLRLRGPGHLRRVTGRARAWASCSPRPGRLAGRTWQNALDLGTSTARVGPAAGRAGPPHPGRAGTVRARRDLRRGVLRARPGGGAGGVPGRRDALAGRRSCTSTRPRSTARCGRRVRLLDEIFPNPRIDTAPVIPVAAAAPGAGHAHRAAVGAAGARRRPAHPGRPGATAGPGRLRDHPGTAAAGGAGPDRAARGTRGRRPRISSGCRAPGARGADVAAARWPRPGDRHRPAAVPPVGPGTVRRRPVACHRPPTVAPPPGAPPPPAEDGNTAADTGRPGWPAANPAPSCPRSWPPRPRRCTRAPTRSCSSASAPH